LISPESEMNSLSPPIGNRNSMIPRVQNPAHRPPVFCRRLVAGFTLVELLVVIAIIAVLAALAFTMTSSFMVRASQTKAASNFRGLGAVIMAYAADNNQQLPGPMQQNQRSGYITNLRNGIGILLWQQMGIPAPTNTFQPIPLLTVPALSKWKYANGHPYPSAYYFVRDVIGPDATNHPFGVAGENPKPPEKLLQIASPSTTWAIWERGGPGDPNKNSRTQLSEPIHGDKRTVLFFDGHVEVVPSASPPPILFK
jgi:prepilin-type N-terminal cleavage/methylation domain-containing protein/prepilin-type processing-associated H-X9-DG protein